MNVLSTMDTKQTKLDSVDVLRVIGATLDDVLRF